jgi:hypothetical protein
MTPARPMHSPENRSPQSPTFHHGSKVSPVKLSMPPQTTSVTTAQDLLNGVMGIGGLNTTRQATSGLTYPGQGQAKFLFGLELPHGPNQSIWSTTRDEQPLIYAGNGHQPGANGSHTIVGGANLSNGLHPGGNFQTTSHGGQIYPPPSHPFSASADSHDLSLSHQSIWSTSYGGPTTSPQRNVPFSTSFSQPSQTVMGTVIPQSHRREQSISGASYPIHLYPNHIQQDPFVYSAPVLQQPPIHHSDPQSSAHFSPSVGHGRLQSFGQSAATNLTSIELGQAPFHGRAVPGHHSRQISNQNYRPEVGQMFIPPNASQVWDNGG